VHEIFDQSDFPDLVVGLKAPDDAAVWRLDEARALVVTTDFFTPIVDDAYTYGAIAAANSLSDVYAMGGKPFLALNIAAFPDNLPLDITREIVRGGAQKAREAGVVVAGGHTVKDREPKYGLAVLGFVDPNRMLGKGGLKVGDALVITKPLGFGVTTTALKQDKVESADLEEAVRWMSQLNATASRLAVEFRLAAGTDVTGFGLLGHALEMAEASGVRLEISYDKIPLLGGALKYVSLGALAGGLFDNQRYFGSQVEFKEGLGDAAQLVLFDPQTSGGLLLGVPAPRLGDFMARARELDQTAWVIGEVRSGNGIRVE
jgi:selenide,water dikinase